ncbi:PLP-dependent aminotransferase family protein [Roseibium sp. RKSG952]|uniref:MocR-like pyridoxine biosynthesis transcription factor PdxR n=1 Tax=Roseibium sp. RKSG952 TaxID=2529384 RepID=UPI0012BC3012|nr:PLP-dependent aminotransferase family protein [Roseibium sp. RKSG952]MTI03408.1 PLP-dependent aminotransferase family protein [Roseibium sp. RKSG952]
MANSVKKYQSNLDSELFALSLDPDEKTALQMQLLEGLRSIIVSSPKYAGARLPASRMLSAELSVSRTTVQTAYDQLISEGYLITRQGSGTFIAENVSHLAPPRPRAKISRYKVDSWLPFQTGLPDTSLMPHALWARHLDRAWRRPDPELLARADPLGWYPLRAAISDHLATWRNLNCAPEQIIITSGAWESLELICRTLIGEGNTVTVEDPCWHKTRDVLSLTGLKEHSARIDHDGLNPAKISHNSAAVIVTPSRHYPTGRSLPMPRRISLLDWADRVGGLIIEDDYDSEFRYQGYPLPSLSGLDGLQHTLYLGSFSKLISTALRIGYMVAPKRLVDKARAYLEQVGPRASLIPQPALAAFMLSGDFAIHLRRMRRIYAQRQSHLISELRAVDDLLEIHPDVAGMHLCLPLKPGLAARTTDQDISRLARQQGLSVGALSAHCVLPTKQQALLLGYAAFDNEVLTKAASKLCHVLRG